MSPCIDHGGSSTTGGYSLLVQRNYKQRRKHVWALMDKTGEQPNGRIACHTCDNPRCINPEHLYWGTDKSNAQDREQRGRAYVGTRVRKLSPEQAQDVRSLAAGGATYASLDRWFEVSHGTCRKIVLGRKYKEDLCQPS